MVFVARQLPKRRTRLLVVRRTLEDDPIPSDGTHHIAQLRLHKLRSLQRERVSRLGRAGPADPRIEHLDQLGVLALAAIDLADERKRFGVVGIDIEDRAQLAGGLRWVVQLFVMKTGGLEPQAAQGPHVMAGLGLSLQHLGQTRPVA